MTDQPAPLEVLRRKLIDWHAMGVSRVPARDGAAGLIAELAENGFAVVPKEWSVEMYRAFWAAYDGHPEGEGKFNAWQAGVDAALSIVHGEGPPDPQSGFTKSGRGSAA